jgi:lipopolysaccharide export system permease protein
MKNLNERLTIYKSSSFFLPFYSIWGRYFFKETLKIFLLFIFCFYALYVLIDFSSHSASLTRQISSRWQELCVYYLCDFVKRLEVLIPFALMIATVKTLCDLNTHNELVALMAGGIKLKTLLKPFISLALFFVMVIYFNTELILPMSLKKINMIDASRAKMKNKIHDFPSVQHVILEDESTLIFRDYDRLKKRFVDAYWIRSIDDVYRMKYLYPYMEKPLGEYVDHLQRNEDKRLTLYDSQTLKVFPEIHFNNQKLTETLTQPQDLSITAIKKKLPAALSNLNEKESQILTVYYYKIIMPWLCLLAVISPIPFCVNFNRQLPVFFIYATSIFGLVAFYLIMDASLILGSRQVIQPGLAIFTPFLLVFGFFSMRYIRLN